MSGVTEHAVRKKDMTINWATPMCSFSSNTSIFWCAFAHRFPCHFSPTRLELNSLDRPMATGWLTTLLLLHYLSATPNLSLQYTLAEICRMWLLADTISGKATRCWASTSAAIVLYSSFDERKNSLQRDKLLSSCIDISYLRQDERLTRRARLTVTAIREPRYQQNTSVAYDELWCQKWSGSLESSQSCPPWSAEDFFYLLWSDWMIRISN